MDDRRAWVAALMRELGASGPTGLEYEQYLRSRKVRIGVRSQSSGARWTLGGHIDLSPRYLHDAPSSPYALSLVVHEIQHLRQGPLTALSVYGELQAWQTQFRFLLELVGGYTGVPGQVTAIRELLQLPLGWDRAALAAARHLMREYAGRRYRVDLLPLYPLHREILYVLLRRRPDLTSVR